MSVSRVDPRFKRDFFTKVFFRVRALEYTEIESRRACSEALEQKFYLARHKWAYHIVKNQLAYNRLQLILFVTLVPAIVLGVLTFHVGYPLALLCVKESLLKKTINICVHNANYLLNNTFMYNPLAFIHAFQFRLLSLIVEKYV